MSSGFGEKTLEQGILIRVVDDIAHGDPVPRSGNNFVGPFLSERSADLDGAHAVLGSGHGPLEGFLEAGDRENVADHMFRLEYGDILGCVELFSHEQECEFLFHADSIGVCFGCVIENG